MGSILSTPGANQEKKVPFVSPYAQAAKEREDREAAEEAQAEEEKRARQTSLMCSVLLGKNYKKPSKKDLKKWESFMSQAEAIKKVSVGLDKMIKVGEENPTKTTTA